MLFDNGGTMQKVSFGFTQSGQPGLFTGGFLAWPLSASELEKLSVMSFDEAKEYIARRWRFDLVSPFGQDRVG